MEPIADDLWEITAEHRMPGGVVFPLRCTVVALSDGLWVHSPIAFTNEQAAAIEALGTVRHLVAPSKMHDLHLVAAAERWPDAAVYGPREVLEDKRLHGVDLDQAEWPELQAFPIRGADMAGETAFLHRPSRTLLVTDLLFNFGPAENLQTGLLRWAIGCRECLAASRSWRWVFADDRSALADSVSQLLDADFDRLVPCHGAVVSAGAKEAMRTGVTGRLV